MSHVLKTGDWKGEKRKAGGKEGRTAGSKAGRMVGKVVRRNKK